MGIEAIHSPPVDLWMQMLLKRWWRDLMSYVFCVSTEDEWLMRLFFHSTLLPPWCVIVMPRGKGWGNDALHYMTGDWACFLSAAVLQRIVNHHMDGCMCGSFTISLHNDHLPVKGPCESHYPWSNRRWQGKGMERTDVRWQALCFLMSVSCLQGEDSQPPFLQRIHRARKVIRPLQHHYVCWIMFSFLGKPHIYSLMCSLKGGRPVVHKITSRSQGFRRKPHHTSHVLWHLDITFLLGVTWPKGCVRGTKHCFGLACTSRLCIEK